MKSANSDERLEGSKRRWETGNSIGKHDSTDLKSTLKYKIRSISSPRKSSGHFERKFNDMLTYNKHLVEDLQLKSLKSSTFRLDAPDASTGFKYDYHYLSKQSKSFLVNELL